MRTRRRLMTVVAVRPLMQSAPEGARMRSRRTRAGPLRGVERCRIVAFTYLSRVRDRTAGGDRAVVD